MKTTLISAGAAPDPRQPKVLITMIDFCGCARAYAYGYQREEVEAEAERQLTAYITMKRALGEIMDRTDFKKRVSTVYL